MKKIYSFLFFFTCFLLFNIAYGVNVELPDGNVLILDSANLPSKEFEGFMNTSLEKEYCRYVNGRTYILASGETYIAPSKNEHCNYNNEDFKNFLEKYNRLSEEEKNEILIEYLKDNNEVFQRYKQLLENRKKFENAKIFDIKTNTIKQAGKRQIQELISDAVYLKNNKVLLIYNNKYPISSKFEIYDIKSDTFKEIKNEDDIYLSVYLVSNEGNIFYYDTLGQKYPNHNINILNPDTMKTIYKDISNGIRISYMDNLSDDNVFLISRNDGIFIYDTKTNKFKFTGIKIPYFVIDTFKGGNDTFYIITNGTVNPKHDIDKKKIYKYSYKTNNLELLGELLAKRGNDYKILYIPDKELIVTLGKKDYYWDGSYNLEKRIELFNLKTGKSRFINDNSKLALSKQYKAFYEYKEVTSKDGIKIKYPRNYEGHKKEYYTGERYNMPKSVDDLIFKKTSL